MMMTMVPGKFKFKKQQNIKPSVKSGISVISCKLMKRNIQLFSAKQKNKQNNHQNSKSQRVVLRSLSAERVRRKKQKINKKSECGQNQINREEMQCNIHLLQKQYDQLRLKRSYVTQRQNERQGEMRTKQSLDIYSDKKIENIRKQNMFITKCIPKSKINLNQEKYQSSKTLQLKTISDKNSQRSVQKILKTQKIRQESNQIDLFISNKQRQKSMQILKISCISQNLQNKKIHSIGVNQIQMSRSVISLKKQSEDFQKKSYIQDYSKTLCNSFNKRKGIKVVSSQINSNSSSLNSSSISLYVSRQLQRGKNCNQLKQKRRQK